MLSDKSDKTGKKLVKAAVLRRAGDPLEIEPVLQNAPQPNEVRVRVVAAGKCVFKFPKMLRRQTLISDLALHGIVVK